MPIFAPKAGGCGGVPLRQHQQRAISILSIFFLENNADINAQGGSLRKCPPSSIIKSGHLDIVKILLENNADINVQDEYHGTGLWQASENGHLEVVKLLLDKEQILLSQIMRDGRRLTRLQITATLR